ncbi:cell division protein kinase [Grosmannia clavigera kw1407]|uniref:cyclin-dependent kinase n=1 Tax=Grosmannia clavigera (strain kw1407 / UAMH 11150) TaxID=655863 RepID=F0X818_GROCL|nr:cell division protein kinase [Grosmannia clavigera kw1407]EFX05375.1 cell division protein kinase [Grosmannia clavigera kw1407]
MKSKCQTQSISNRSAVHVEDTEKEPALTPTAPGSHYYCPEKDGPDEDYETACELLSEPPAAAGKNVHGAIMEANLGDTMNHDDENDLQIGSYTQCCYISSGVTADVFRSGTRALKVITETRDMQPHDHVREAKILGLVCRQCIPLLETFHDQEQRFVLVFPYMPLSLDAVLARTDELLSLQRLCSYFVDIFGALAHIHGLGIIHRDVKPSAFMMASPDGPVLLSDFGTAWHPALSQAVEPADGKVLDIGTGPYRAPEALFGNQAYGPSVDMWAAGAMLAESARRPPSTLFTSRPAHEDGSQLGLILSIFKTIGTPTAETWPEAASFKTPPFEMYRVFEPPSWEDILPEVNPHIRALVARLIKYDSTRATAEQALVDILKLAT